MKKISSMSTKVRAIVVELTTTTLKLNFISKHLLKLSSQAKNITIY